MSEYLFQNFEMTRNLFFRELTGVTEEMADVQPEGFNNTIHWHVGHVLTATEGFMFGFPTKSQNLPANYKELFGNGTKPGDWTEAVPSMEELLVQLKEQVGRLKEIPAASFEQKLQNPFLGLETFGQLANMALYHESHHMGQIHVMKRIIQQGK
ncbi:MAG: DinB family protein [Bacillota bacterium]|nr:DinB family protein [Bacillota bacterium]MDP4171139.1 DinB family protein [Bacillota bacterium]